MVIGPKRVAAERVWACQ